MKENELRVGNFVNPSSPIKINYHDIEISDVLNPIQLTEEWVLKFGFELYGESGNDKYFTKNGFNIAILDEQYYFTGVIDGKKINYVHQLQNLYFALTEEEIDYLQEKLYKKNRAVF